MTGLIRLAKQELDAVRAVTCRHGLDPSRGTCTTCAKTKEEAANAEAQ